MSELNYLIAKNVIQGIIVCQSIFFGFFLWSHPKAKKFSNRVLSLFLIVLFLHFLYLLISDHIQTVHFPVSFLLLSLYGPLLLMYVTSFASPSWRPSWNEGLHAILAIYVCAAYFFFKFTPHNDERIFRDGLHLPVYSVLSIYLMITWLKLSRIQKNVDEKSGRWLKLILYLFVGAFVLYLIFLLLRFYDYSLSARLIRLLSFVIFILLINSLVVQALRYPSIILDEFYNLDNENTLKYASSSLSPEQAEREAVRLGEIMQRDKLFRKYDMTLKDLANTLSMDPRHISQIINTRFNTNFRDYLNQYRIRDAVELLNNPDNNTLSIKEIMHLVGFNSRSNFNTLFKEVTGLTPTDYKNTVQITFSSKKP